MMRFEVDYTGADKIKNALHGLNEAFGPKDRKYILRMIGSLYVSDTKDRFAKQFDVDRKKWKPLRPVTINKKRIKGSIKGPSHIGVWQGKLINSLGMRVDGNSVVIGTNVVYAKNFHYFVKKGAYGKDKFGRPIPWGDIPRRSFLGRNNRMDSKVLTALRKFFIYKMGFDKTFVNENFR